MKCVDGVCKKQNKRLSFVNSDAIVPSECDISDLRNLFSYFQYRAPNIDSVQSPLLSSDIHDKVLAKMLHNNSDYKFYSHNLDSSILLQQHGMSDDHVCDRCKRFVCKYMTNPANVLPQGRKLTLSAFFATFATQLHTVMCFCIMVVIILLWVLKIKMRKRI